MNRSRSDLDRIAFLLGVLAALMFATIAVAQEQGQEEPLVEAKRQLEAGRLFRAEQAAHEAVEREPDSAEAHFVLGEILLARTRFDEAEAAFTRAASLEPKPRGLDRALGLVRFELEDFAGARGPLERALETTPDDAELWMRLGLSELELGRPDRATAAFEQAARDPAWTALAQYNLGVARQSMGEDASARRAFEQAISSGLPVTIAERAAKQLAAPSEGERSWSLSAAAGALFESAVAQPESDQIDRDPDGAAQLEFGGSWEPDYAGTNARLGYDFYQKLYFATEDFDLQSHTLSARVGRRFGPVASSLGYVYSLNLLGDSSDRFLDFHELRLTGGMSLSKHWYASLSPGFRVKRFDRSRDAERDANSPIVTLLQLFPIGDWSRYVLLGFTYVYEDAQAAFEHHGMQAQLALHLPFPVGAGEWPLDVRYSFELRDYLSDASLVGSGSRQDVEHSARIRWGIPLGGPFQLRAEYEFEDVDSQRASADRTVHRVGMTLQLEY